jgi:hypothetical protein
VNIDETAEDHNVEVELESMVLTNKDFNDDLDGIKYGLERVCVYDVVWDMSDAEKITTSGFGSWSSPQ